MNPQYLTDEGGRKIAVVLPAQESEELMEDVSDLAVGAERTYRIRVGDCRIVYEIEDEVVVVLVIRVAHRREAYR